MGKSKRQADLEQINALAADYKKFTDKQLIDFVNRSSLSTPKNYRVAVNNEIKRRVLKIE